MAERFVIIAVTDGEELINSYWDGSQFVEDIDGGMMYVNLRDSRTEAGRLQNIYPNKDVNSRAVTMTVVLK